MGPGPRLINIIINRIATITINRIAIITINIIAMITINRIAIGRDGRREPPMTSLELMTNVKRSNGHYALSLNPL